MASHGLGNENFTSGTGILLLGQEEAFALAPGSESNRDSCVKSNGSYLLEGKIAGA
jgi:hypothetical protein